MAASAANNGATGFDDDPSDEQMQEILSQAAKRLQEKSVASKSGNGEQAQQFHFPKLDVGNLESPYVSSDGTVASIDTSRLPQKQNVQKQLGPRKIEDPAVTKSAAIEKKKASAGKNWFNMPKTDLTPELKRDLQLLKMRNVLDPHRHYKKDGGKMKAPEYSQVGIIQEGPTEFFSGRIENRNRKQTLVEEVLAGEQDSGRFKRKYGDIQDKKTSGKKAFYKALKAKRQGGIKKGSG
ncbi:Fcf2-domain-containing protein [Polychaeton citri CBS 116435]|uniref:Fcf2-domain-containing protein n=1 Tax=Polychaeton citri CBS 116435 TaxID=1314669 RepID=A0A9P4Q0Q7_9PEZI|nr:Fcf2-domain-containing protein [Polychaeton citri CBS 116435]